MTWDEDRFRALVAEIEAEGAGQSDFDGPTEETPPTTWAEVDLTSALAGEDLPAPELLARADGRCLLYRARVHWFQGESEACKTWAALGGAAQVVNAGGDVLWIDFEDDDRGVVARLRALGVNPETIREYFHYVRPDEPLRRRDGFTPAIGDFRALLEHTYELAVIDGVTEALTVEGLSLIDNADIATWLRLLPKRIATTTGAAVICIDHVTKDREGQGRYALGAQHKLAGVTGAAYKFEVRQRFRRAEADPIEGAVAITVTKDRPGWIRAHAANSDTAATMFLTSWPDGGVTIALQPAEQNTTPDLALCRRIAEHLATYDGATGRHIEDTVTGKAAAIREAIKWMADDARKWVRIERSGRSHLHFLTDQGREDFGQ